MSPALQADSLPAEPPGKPSGLLFSHKKNELIPFIGTWMDLEIIISEINQTEKDKYHIRSLTCGI